MVENNNIDFFWRDWKIKEINIELEYFTKNPQSKIKTIKDKLISNKKLENIKLKAYKKLEKEYFKEE